MSSVGIIITTTGILAAAGVLTLAMKRASASARHTVWIVGLWAVLVIPPASRVLPRIELSVAPHDPVVGKLSTAWPEFIKSPALAVEVPSNTVSEGPEVQQPIIANSPEPVWRIRQHWISILWGLGTLVIVIRSILGILELQRLRRGSTPVTELRWHDLVNEAKAELSVRKPVELRVSGRNIPPMTWGIFRSVVLLPAAASQWTDERLRMVLVHELAHIKRNDGFTQVLVQIACSLYWFNPLVWYAAYRIRIERERACDDCVVRLGLQADDYADHLLQIARRMHAGTSFATVGMAHPSQLESRLLAILDPNTRRQSMSKLATVSLISLVALLTLSVVTIQIAAIAPLVLPAMAMPLAAPLEFAGPIPAAPLQAAQPAVSQEGQVGAVTITVKREGTLEPVPDAQIVVGGVISVDQTSFPMPATDIPTVFTLDNAILFIQSTNPRTGVTDSQGQVTIRDIPPGGTFVSARRQGYFGPAFNGTRIAVASQKIQVTPGKTVEVTLFLMASGTMSGRITDASGRAVADSSVQVFRSTYRNGSIGFEVAEERVTDDRGEYRVFGLPPGEYYVAANPPKSRIQLPRLTVSDVQQLLTQTFFPGVSDISQAKPIEVRSGGDTAVDLRLREEMAVSVSGRVVGDLPPGPVVSTQASAQVPAGTTRSATPGIVLLSRSVSGSVISRQVSSQPDGAFQIMDVGPGDYDIFAYLPVAHGWGGQNAPGLAALPYAFGRASIRVSGRRVDDVRIAVHHGVDVKGRILVDGRSSPVNLGISLQVIDSAAGAGGLVGNVYGQVRLFQPAIEPDGSFSIPLVPEGHYRLQISLTGATRAPGGQRGLPAASLPALPPGSYIVDIRQDGVSVYDGGIRIGAQPINALEVRIGTDGGRVLGSAIGINNEPVDGKFVALVPLEEHRRTNPALFVTDRSDVDGRFEFQGVAPGSYKLFAWESVPPGAHLNPEFLRRHESGSVPVAVRGSTTTEVRVPLLR